MTLLSNLFSALIIIALAVMMLTQGEPERQTSTDLSQDDLGCLVANVYHEARGEDALGQAAVAHVTLNRVKSPAYPDSACAVVWQKTFLDGQWIPQFEWTLDGQSGRMTDPEAIRKAVDITLGVARGKIKDPTGGALHFYAHKQVKPSWARGGHRLIVGEHTFVRRAGR